ncbi:MAG: c-type cytochrome [Rhodospirillales bacterium]|nr:c-type cytochrome [Rhodospirillales bacterium]
MKLVPINDIVLGALFILPLVLAPAAPAYAGHEHENGNGLSSTSKKTELVLPVMDVNRGKNLFVSKGCVACHAVNGVGGHDAPAMDDHTNLGRINPFDFVAKMWNHAPGMLAAQEQAFGKHITFTGAEISDIIAFVHDDGAQHAFTEKDLTKRARMMMGHEHGGEKAPVAHAQEIGHAHGPNSKPHKD